MLTPDAFARTAALGDQLAYRAAHALAAAGVPWSVDQLGRHALYFFAPEPPGDAAARAADDPGLRALIRVFLANRGVWESGGGSAPRSRSLALPTDVDRYLGVQRAPRSRRLSRCHLCGMLTRSGDWYMPRPC